MGLPSVTISLNSNTTEAVDLNGRVLCGVHVPTGFNGGSFTLQTALTTDGTYYAVQDGNSNNVTVTFSSPPCFVPFDTTKTQGINRFLKLVSNTNANANFTLVLSIR